jgi:hypothetical protein
LSRALLPWLPRTRSILVLVLRLASDLLLEYLYRFKGINRKHIRWPAIDICKPHKKYLFPYCYSPLQSNGSYAIVAYVFIDAGMCLLCLCPGTCLHVKIYLKQLQDLLCFWSAFTLFFFFFCLAYSSVWRWRQTIEIYYMWINLYTSTISAILQMLEVKSNKFNVDRSVFMQ